MSCQCTFALLSHTSGGYQNESYSLPCDIAKDFLKSLTSRKFPVKGREELPFIVHRYTLLKGEEKYTSSDQELPELAAAKIQLFMLDSKFTPKDP